MKITVDTNILIAGTLWYGASFKILRAVEEKKVDLIISPEILEEFITAMEYPEIQEKIKNKNLEMKFTAVKIKEIATIVYPSQKLQAVPDDPDDNIIVECAVEGKVDYLISKDNHLLKLKSYDGIPIITPEEFLKLI
ncbi:MAG TPA: putative toxin-antitoxin system toxin component, PIN family [Candidatus Nanoarchaeia archaeon]|nr:putative toxin-antitoxin system toxin component, PIN family [Candidatus Nanoarchaeia archaeon]